MAFSFYYTEQIALIVLNKNPLMVTINEEASNYNVLPANAIIEGDYIIPGLNGLMVNTRESFYNMRSQEVFSKLFLVYEQVKPSVSLENNKDKIIRMGNQKLKQVSIILEKENEISNYLKSKEIKASMLVKLDNFNIDYFQLINNETEGFKSLENIINLNKKNVHICVLNETNKDVCLKSKNYLVDPNIKLTSTNINEVKKSLENGSIIKISESATLNDVKLLLREISYKDLEIVYLSDLISEERMQ